MAFLLTLRQSVTRRRELRRFLRINSLQSRSVPTDVPYDRGVSRYQRPSLATLTSTLISSSLGQARSSLSAASEVIRVHWPMERTSN